MRAKLFSSIMFFFRYLAVLLVLSVSLPGTGPGKPSRPIAVANHPNIILITLDTTRADRMGFLGSNRGLTPNLDALAKHSVVFTRAYAQVPLTTPSHAALLTGTYPQFNHVEDLGSVLRPELPYLPDLLHQQGYHTAAFLGSMVLDTVRHAAPGFDRGFEVYDADFHNPKPGEDRYSSVERRAEDVANRAMGWLSHRPSGPFFLWLHFYDPHEPYDPPEPFKAHFASEPYDGEIAYTDSVVGSLLEVLVRHELYQNTVIAIAADHGEAFGEHGERWHGMFLYDETVHVPLLLKLPGEKFGGKRVEERVALADVAPSLLQSANLPIPAAMQAQSLLPLLDASKSGAGTKSSKPKERAIYSETNYPHRSFGWSELRSWRAQKYLYVQAPKKELYDQSTDPGALKNMAGTANAVVETMDSQLSDFNKKTSSAADDRKQLDPAQEENLRALGYLGSTVDNSSSKEKALVDPKDKIDFANRLHETLFELEDEHFDEAVTQLNDLAKQYPSEASGAYLEFGRVLIHNEKYQEAEPFLRTAIVKAPESSLAHCELGLALIKQGHWDTALPEIQAAVDRQPTSAQFHFYLAGVHVRLNQLPQADAEYEKALGIDPEHFQANLLYGRLLLREGHSEAALPKLNRAAKLVPDSAEAHVFLAEAYDKLGQAQNASEERATAARLKAQAAEQTPQEKDPHYKDPQ